MINEDFTYRQGMDKRTDQGLYYALSSHADNQGDFGSDYGDDWNKQNVVKMVLNTKHKTLEFHVDGKYQGIAFQHIQFDDTCYIDVYQQCQ